MEGGQPGAAALTGPDTAHQTVRTAAELAAMLDGAEDLLAEVDADALFADVTRAEQEALALDAPELAARARLAQADLLERKGRTTAVRTMWEVLRWATEHDSPALLSRSHLLLSRTYADLGDNALRLEHAVNAVETLPATQPDHVRAYHLLKLADALKHNGSMDAARERYRQAERLATASGRVELLLTVLNNRAYAENMAGEPERSWSVIERLRDVAAAHGRPLDPAQLDTVALTEIALGRYAEAEHTVQAGIRDYLAQGQEIAADWAEQHLTLAIAQRSLGALDRAQTSLDTCVRACVGGDFAGIAVRALREQAELFAAAGDYRNAFEAHKAFHAAAEELRSKEREARAHSRHAVLETTEARQEAERFREQARRDPLTGLRNRRHVDENLPALVTHATATGEPLTIALVDLDHFKRVNDTLSHDAGDRVLVSVAGMLAAAAGEHGFAARVGGEEFLVVLPDAGVETAAGQLDALRETVGAYPWGPLTGGLPVTVSIGAVTTTSAATQGSLLAAADRNLYRAKRTGRNRVVCDQFPTRHRRRYRT